MKILATMPGKFGDILWALPTIRAISEAVGEPVDLVTTAKYAPLSPLLHVQPYIRRAYTWAGWDALPPPNTGQNFPHVPEGLPVGEEIDAVVHLGYPAWPTRGLPYYIERQARRQCVACGLPSMGHLDLNTPWITVDGPGSPCEIAVGFSDEHFELKVGLVTLLDQMPAPFLVLAPEGSRWERERPVPSYPLEVCDWLGAARVIRNADLFLGDCSALHVLACGLGKRCVIMEPSEARWNAIFWPYGMDGPRVTCVTGNDGKPTFDARAVRAAVEAGLAAGGTA